MCCGEAVGDATDAKAVGPGLLIMIVKSSASALLSEVCVHLPKCISELVFKFFSEAIHYCILKNKLQFPTSCTGKNDYVRVVSVAITLLVRSYLAYAYFLF